MQNYLLLLFAFIWSGFGVVRCQDETQIEYITPTLGSLNGGTRISIFGSDFTTNLNLSDPNPAIEVYFVTTYSEYECLVHDAESDERQVVCYTVPMPEANYYVRMKQHGVWLEEYQYCNRRFFNGACRLRARWGWTPRVYNIEEQTGEPGRLLRARGVLFTNLTSSAETEASNGRRDVAITRAYVTAGVCQLYNDTTMEPFGVSLEGSEGESQWGTIVCKIQPTYIGYQNVSFIVSGEFGRSASYRRTHRVSAANTIYTIETYAAVTDVSPKEGSLNGGSFLTISGRNFDENDTQVYVGGEECEIVDVTQWQITCMTPSAPLERAFYSGGRGINIEVFPGMTDINANLSTSADGYFTWYEDSTFLNHYTLRDPIDNNGVHQLVSRSRGYFVPSQTANYQFSIIGDDHTEFFFNPQGADSDDAILIAFAYRGYVTNYSASYALTKGEHYFFDLRHVDFGGPEFFRIGVHADQTILTSAQTDWVVSEKQVVKISSVIEQEKHKVTFVDWVEEEAVEPVFTLETTCLMNDTQSCYNYYFTVTLFGMTSKNLRFGLPATSLQSSIEELMSVLGDEVSVTESDYVYEIRFLTNKGHPVFSAASQDEEKIEVTLTTDTVGKPDLANFVFTINGLLSAPLAIEADEEEIEEAVKYLYAPKCPEEIGASIGRSRKYYDMEDDEEEIPSGERSEFDSFCGGFSLRNPRNIFSDQERPYYSSVFRDVCFAYIGDIQSRLEVRYNYLEDSEAGTISIDQDWNNVGGVPYSDSIDSWTHVCFDLHVRFQAIHPNGRNFQVSGIRISQGHLSDVSLYLDNIFIGQVTRTSDEIDEAIASVIPPAVPHLRLRNVEVNRTGEYEFDITYDPINCGINFPLIGFSFSNGEVVMSNNKVSHQFGDGASEIVVERIATASPPVTGFFDLEFLNSDFRDVTNIPADATSEWLKSQLQVLPEIGDVSVTRGDSCYGYSWTVVFNSPGGSFPLMQPVNADLMSAPQNANITSFRETLGGLNLHPIPGDFIRAAFEDPQVEVYVNGVPSKCVANYDGDNQTSCQFNWLESATPSLNGISVESTRKKRAVGIISASAGTTIVLTGSGFSDDTSQVEVLVGGVSCEVTSSSLTMIQCTLGNSPAGEQSIIVNINPSGAATANLTHATILVTGAVESFSPASGSVHGCVELTIAGSGFNQNSTVSIGSYDCEVTSTSYNQIICITEAASAIGTQTVAVTTSGTTINAATNFAYTDTGIGDITSVSPTSLSVAGGMLTIIGTGFGSTPGKVMIGSVEIETIDSWTDTEITLTYPTFPSGNYDVVVIVEMTGCAANSPTVSVSFSVTNVQPSSGSLVGGTEVEITGTGLNENTTVQFGDTDCYITSISPDGNSLTCDTGSSGAHEYITNNGRHATFGIGYGWDPSTLDIVAGDEVTFAWSFPILVLGPQIGLFTTSDLLSEEYDEVGFNIPPSKNGRFSFTFNNPGTYYYGSGCIFANCAVFMRGTIVVSEPQDQTKTLKVMTNDAEATYSPGSFSFTFRNALTPEVDQISPRQGTTDTIITIEGSGFTNTAHVEIGGKSCNVESQSNTEITCKISPDQELSTGIVHGVNVHIDGKGDARLDIDFLLNRTFILYPLVSSISPQEGSIEGGTKVTIQGSGFSTSSIVRFNGFITCEIVEEETSYSTITCITSESSIASNGQISVMQGLLTAECTSPTCQYNYTEAATPKINARDHTFDWENLTLTVEGEGFGSTISDITVTFTSREWASDCSVWFLNDTMIICNSQTLGVGRNKLTVHVAGKGFAAFTISEDGINFPPIRPTIDAVNGSVLGGRIINIAGHGFVDVDASVAVGGVPCDIISIDFTLIQCETGPRDAGTVDLVVKLNTWTYPSVDFDYSDAATPSIDSISPAEAVGGATITLSGSGLGMDSVNTHVTVGHVDCEVTSVTDSTIECVLGSREGGPAEVQVQIPDKGFAQVNATFTYLLAISSASPNVGSYGGGQFVVLAGQGFSNRTIVYICEEECVVQNQTSVSIECVTPAMNGSGSTICDVQVWNSNDSTAALTDAYTYSSSVTPTITSVQPPRGGTGGGTKLTISGSGFTSIDSALSVKIDGATCDIESSNDSTIICVTNEHQGSIRAKVEVRVGTSGIATQENADFYYIDRWSSIFTWGGTSLPVDRDFVVIQKGQTVLLDTDTAVLRFLLIDGGELIFDDEQPNVTLHAENILITNDGLLQIGTEEEPYQNKANIIMYGHLRSRELPIYGAKTLGVRNGTLHMHGRHITHPWTKLSATASVGDSQISLEKPVNWLVGDYIVIATTGHRHSQIENEKRRITAISGDQQTLTLDEPLEYEHLGVTETLGGVDVEFRAEVGLLTRNIVFRGTNNHVWNVEIPKCEAGFNTGQFATQTCFQGRFGEEIGSDQFGGSIMIHSKYPNNQDARAYVENVEINYAGQAFKLGRYPIHWHLMGDVKGQYVRRCAIHQTFNRAVTIHGTHNLTVEANVVYDVMGGAIFIEDGIETNNLIQYNLAVFVRQSTSLLNDDVTPAAYWVTNPDNIIRHNHAAGGTHFGFWYRMHEHPDGPSFDPNVCQQHVELGEFYNNTVHSQGWFGLWIFEFYFPMEGGRCDSTVPSPARFRSLTTWRCEKGAEWVSCGAIQFIDFVMVNNEDSGMDLKLVRGTAWGEERGALVKNAVIVGHSDIEDANFETKVAVTLPLAAGLWIDGATFVNFNRGGVIFKVTTVQGLCTTWCGGFYYWTENLSFESVAQKLQWRWLHEGVIVDRDGSFTGRPAMSKVVPFSEIMDTSVCTVESDSSDLSFGLTSAVCEPQIRFHRLALNKPVPTSLEANDLILSNQFGNTSSRYEKKRLTHPEGYMVLLQGKESYIMRFNDGEQFTNITYNSRYYDFLEGDYLFVSHIFKQTPDRIAINGQSRYTIENATALTPNSNNLDWSWDPVGKEFQFIVKGEASNRKRRSLEIIDERYQHVVVQPSIQRCFYEDCIAPVDPDEIPPERTRPDEFVLWSADPNPCLEWVDNDTVVVKKRADGIDICWVVVDVDEIVVDNITVLGVMEFERDTNVSSIYILVLGGRIIAGFASSAPFTHNLNIELRGNHDTLAWVLPGIELGSKALGCFGGCDFHGIDPQIAWTHLNQTAMPGDSTIVVSDMIPKWKVGDEIVITTTGYRSQETEKNEIAAIADDQKTITLRYPLLHRHLGEHYEVGSWSYYMTAEVGVLTRNIKIIGQTYDNINQQNFGARVLVGSFVDTEGFFLRGWARMTNVEFFQTGQEGWTDSFDPRFSLAWVGTGETSNARPSFVRKCAFHDGFSTAIGIFGADNIEVSNNVVHRTIHDGIRVTGSGHSIIGNLVTLTLFRGAINDRFEETSIYDWHSSFELSLADGLTVRGNTAAGSERIGFHIDGESCDAAGVAGWSDNVAHGCLHGVHIFKTDGVGDCSMIRDFFIYKSWDFCIYHQTQTSVLVKDTVLVDCVVGYFPMIFSPDARSHQYVDKSASMEDVLCVGRSEHFDPALDFMDEGTDKNLLVRASGPDRTAPRNPTGGKTCVILPLFESTPNPAPFKPFHGNFNYPTLHGLLLIKGFTAHRFMGNNDGTRDLIFYTNPDNEDAYFPTYLHNVSLYEVETASQVFIARPSLGKINPSDCVDMECDAMKKVLIKDFDGGFLGQAGSIISQAEFGWDDPNQLPRGLGDYRIPKALLTDLDGSLITTSELIDHRGIIRNGACQYESDWQAYNCSGEGVLDYRMLVIESLDEDTETRRISPVALLGDRYIDLNNGPQDHGWCNGYTCQLRLSTFYTIVATGVHFDIYFTGYAPRDLRLHLINVENTESVRVAIRYARPERLDVYRADTGVYIQPEDAYYDPVDDAWKYRQVALEDLDDYKPPVDSPINGANYFDRYNQLLFVTLRGNEPVNIITVPAVVITFDFPAVLVDDFFESNLIENIANFLGIPPSKIRIVNVVRETSRRKRRQTEESTAISVQISDEVTNSTSANTTEVELNPEALNEATDMLLEAFQEGGLAEVLNVTEVGGFASTTAVINVTEANLEEPTLSSVVHHRIPSQMNLTWAAEDAQEYLYFPSSPCINMVDDQGEAVPDLGGNWTAHVELEREQDVGFGGEFDVEFEHGKATFSNLYLTHEGTYSLLFTVVKPNGDEIGPVSMDITVVAREVAAVLVGQPAYQYLQLNGTPTFMIELQDANGDLLQHPGFKGHKWMAEVTLGNAMFDETISGMTLFNFSYESSMLSISGFTVVDPIRDANYTFNIRVFTEPALHSFILVTSPVEFNSTRNGTVITPSPPDLVCPYVEDPDRFMARSMWLCDYIKWKFDFLFVWSVAVVEWRNLTRYGQHYDHHYDHHGNHYHPHNDHYDHPSNHYDHMIDDLDNMECDELQVSCNNGGQWGQVEDPNGCLIPYCLDGYYNTGPGFQHWVRDYAKWRQVFNHWRGLLKKFKEEICQNSYMLRRAHKPGNMPGGLENLCY